MPRRLSVKTRQAALEGYEAALRKRIEALTKKGSRVKEKTLQADAVKMLEERLQEIDKLIAQYNDLEVLANEYRDEERVKELRKRHRTRIRRQLAHWPGLSLELADVVTEELFPKRKPRSKKHS